MTAATETAFAKINLALHVRRREADGYHAIETLFAFAEDGDALRATDRPGLIVTGPFASSISDDASNLVLRAAQGFVALTGQGADIGFVLDKRLPVAAGIGGGSADAAAALRLLCARHDLDMASTAILSLAASLGADVPACLLSRSARGEGKGDVLTPVNGLTGTAILLVNPMQPLATGPVFAAWDGVDRGPLQQGDPLAGARAGRNDLEPPAIRLLPVIDDVLMHLRSRDGMTLVRMSGSGATCFALFDALTTRDAAAVAIAAAHPDWWQMATTLR